MVVRVRPIDAPWAPSSMSFARAASVEGTATFAGLRIDGQRVFPDMVPAGRVRDALVAVFGAVRCAGGHRLAVVGGRRRHDQVPFGGEAVGPNPTDRAKTGTKRSLLVDARGVPLSLVVAGANRHDMKLLEPTLAAIQAPEPDDAIIGLSLDKGYDFPQVRQLIHQYQSLMVSICFPE